MINQHEIRSTLFERVGFAFIIAVSGELLVLGEARRFRRTRDLHVRMRALGANHRILLDIVVVRRHPRDKQTRVGAWNDVVDIKPDTVNTSGKVGVTGGLGSGIVIIILLVILFNVVCVLFL